MRDNFSGDIVTYETAKKRRSAESVDNHNVVAMVLLLAIVLFLTLLGCAKERADLMQYQDLPIVYPAHLVSGVLNKTDQKNLRK